MGPVLGVGVFLEARARSLQGNPRPTSPGRAGPVRSSVAAPDCCGGLGNLDFRKADLCIMTRLLGYVDLSEPHFVAAVLAIVFNPLFWNVLHAGHAEPAPDAEPGQPRGLPCGPGTPGSGWRVRPFQFPGAGLHRDLPRRLLRDPQGGQSDHVPVQHPGQPHVLGQHSHLPGLGHCALHCRNLSAESLPGLQEELTATATLGEFPPQACPEHRPLKGGKRCLARTVQCLGNTA
ncbi:PREDICTED: phosphatidylethanolamine N-methyltransferase isoform X1 [Bison bison bison]|uniref:Phosphatidylethanolamine N-methyltransferase isoform X1 n=2 Tax=Bison bison bison TaxID=43346 RepID=A0A6P3HDX7_BISBB|nr:PREDICTED: phosphatidylethanolamine N-methyltransferase isoform X1 [Bison bison bison]